MIGPPSNVPVDQTHTVCTHTSCAALMDGGHDAALYLSLLLFPIIYSAGSVLLCCVDGVCTHVYARLYVRLSHGNELV